MMLVPREIEKMMIWTAAQIAEGRKQRGVKLNYPESIAYISNFVVEGAREGKTVAELMMVCKKYFDKSRCNGRSIRNDSYSSSRSYISRWNKTCNSSRSSSVVGYVK